MNCIFLCRIWKIEDIQQLKLFPVPCSLFPVPCFHRQLLWLRHAGYQQALSNEK
ncbi:MAG: hypothetical protein ACK57R_07445 [Dolichospermum sp.]